MKFVLYLVCFLNALVWFCRLVCAFFPWYEWVCIFYLWYVFFTVGMRFWRLVCLLVCIFYLWYAFFTFGMHILSFVVVIYLSKAFFDFNKQFLLLIYNVYVWNRSFTFHVQWKMIYFYRKKKNRNVSNALFDENKENTIFWTSYISCTEATPMER